MSALNRIAVASLSLGLQVTAAVADDPPKLDVTTTCNAAAQFSIVIGRDKEACLDDERTAESTLAQNWSKSCDQILSRPCLRRNTPKRLGARRTSALGPRPVSQPRLFFCDGLVRSVE